MNSSCDGLNPEYLGIYCTLDPYIPSTLIVNHEPESWDTISNKVMSALVNVVVKGYLEGPYIRGHGPIGSIDTNNYFIV